MSQTQQPAHHSAVAPAPQPSAPTTSTLQSVQDLVALLEQERQQRRGAEQTVLALRQQLALDAEIATLYPRSTGGLRWLAVAAVLLCATAALHFGISAPAVARAEVRAQMAEQQRRLDAARAQAKLGEQEAQARKQLGILQQQLLEARQNRMIQRPAPVRTQRRAAPARPVRFARRRPVRRRRARPFRARPRRVARRPVKRSLRIPLDPNDPIAGVDDLDL